MSESESDRIQGKKRERGQSRRRGVEEESRSSTTYKEVHIYNAVCVL